MSLIIDCVDRKDIFCKIRRRGIRLPLHAAMWALFLVAFFTFLRKSNLVPDNTRQISSKVITRANLVFTSAGANIHVFLFFFFFLFFFLIIIILFQLFFLITFIWLQHF